MASMRKPIPFFVLIILASIGLSACSGGRDSPSNIAVLENPRPVSLSEAQLKVIRRDVSPSIRNAVAEGSALKVATAEFSEVQATTAGGKVYACGYAKVLNVQLEISRKLAFAGELFGSNLFVREFIGGNESQNDFVRDVCRKRGMELG